jgi:hypothetical protein
MIKNDVMRSFVFVLHLATFTFQTMTTLCLSGEFTRPSSRSTHLRRPTTVVIRSIETSADSQFSKRFLAFQFFVTFLYF